MLRKGASVKVISGDEMGELGMSGNVMMILAKRDARWQRSPPKGPKGNGMAKRAIQQLDPRLDVQKTNLLEDTRSIVTGGKEAGLDHDVKEGANEDSSRGIAPDSGLRRSRRFGATPAPGVRQHAIRSLEEFRS